MKFRPKNRGFTLIELLVVISIISLLSSVVLSSLNSARAKARDARRLSDMRQVQLALELYKSKYDTYPSPVGAFRENSCFERPEGPTSYSMAVGQWGRALGVLVTDGLMSRLPSDPLNDTVYGGAYPYNCYTYNRAASYSYYAACRNVETGAVEFLGDYEYILYYSLEQRPLTKGYVLWWGANATENNDSNPDRPQYGCLFGPRR